MVLLTCRAFMFGVFIDLVLIAESSWHIYDSLLESQVHNLRTSTAILLFVFATNSRSDSFFGVSTCLFEDDIQSFDRPLSTDTHILRSMGLCCRPGRTSFSVFIGRGFCHTQQQTHHSGVKVEIVGKNKMKSDLKSRIHHHHQEGSRVCNTEEDWSHKSRWYIYIQMRWCTPSTPNWCFFFWVVPQIRNESGYKAYPIAWCVWCVWRRLGGGGYWVHVPKHRGYFTKKKKIFLFFHRPIDFLWVVGR